MRLARIAAIALLGIVLVFTVACKSEPQVQITYCAAGCQTSWLGDGICQNACNNVACYYDNGDCPSNTPTPTPPPTPIPSVEPTVTPTPALEPTSVPTSTPTSIPTAIPTPTPTPTPTLGYSRSNPAPIGTTMATQFSLIGDTFVAEITVTEIVRGQPAWDMISAANMFNDEPPSGYEYILAKIRFRHISSSPSPDEIFDWFYFELVSAEGETIDRPFAVEPEPTLNDVYPGATTEGWEAFLVEIGDPAPSLTFGTSSGGSTSRTWFKLYY